MNYHTIECPFCSGSGSESRTSGFFNGKDLPEELGTCTVCYGKKTMDKVQAAEIRSRYLVSKAIADKMNVDWNHIYEGNRFLIANNITHALVNNNHSQPSQTILSTDLSDVNMESLYASEPLVIDTFLWKIIQENNIIEYTQNLLPNE